MANLETKTEKLYEEVDGVMNDYLEAMGGLSSIKNMDKKTFVVVKRTLKMLDLAKDVEVERAKKLDRIENKLDLLLKRK